MRRIRSIAVFELIANGMAVVITKIKGVALIAVLTRYLGVEGYGVWAQVQVLAELAGMVSNLGLPNALIRFYPERDEAGRKQLIWTAYVLVSGTALICALVLAGAASRLADVFGTGADDTGAFVVAAVVAPALALRLLMLTVWRAENKLNRYSGASVTTDLSELGAVLVGAAVTETVVGAAAAYAVVVWGQVVVLFAFHWRRSGRPRRMRDHRSLLRYSLPVVPSALSWEGLARADRLIVGALLGPAAAGLYSSLYAVASTLSLVSQPFTNVLLPRLTRLRPDQMGGALRRYVAGYLALGFPLLGGIVAFSPQLTSLLIGSNVAGNEARAVIALAGTGTLLMGVGRIQALALLAKDRTPALFWLSATAACGNVALNLLLVPLFGIRGAATATMVSYGGYMLVQWWVTKRPERLDARRPSSGGTVDVDGVDLVYPHGPDRA